MGDVKLFRLSGSAAVIDLRTGNNATLRPGLVVLSEDAHTHAIAALEAENAKLRAELERLPVDWWKLAVDNVAGYAHLYNSGSGIIHEIRAEHARLLAAAPAQPAAQQEQHPDDQAVDRFAIAMKVKLAKSREKGRRGWQTASAAHLSGLLYRHMYKADPLDVANLAMMLHQNGQAIELPHEARHDQGEVLTEHSGCGRGIQVDQLTVRMYPGDKVVMVRGRIGKALAAALEAKAAPVGEREAAIEAAYAAVRDGGWDSVKDMGIQMFQAGAAYQRAQQPHSAEAVDMGSEWTPCVKLPVVVHVRQQRDGENHVSTREGITPIKPDDLIMRGVAGEEYPIGRELFERTYTFDTTPQPSAGVVMPERNERRTTYDAEEVYQNGWNACLDEFARLNGKEVGRG